MTTKTFYLYDEVTKEFFCNYEAQESPLEPGIFITPICSTEIEPLPMVEGFYNYFNVDTLAWQLKDDTRGIWYKLNRDIVEITSLSDVIDPTLSRKFPAYSDAELLQQSINNVRNSLQTAIDIKAQSLGFSGGNALMLYVGFTNAFQTIAQGFAVWEASVWFEAEQYKAQVIAGNQPMLTPEQAVAMMPTYP